MAKYLSLHDWDSTVIAGREDLDNWGISELPGTSDDFSKIIRAPSLIPYAKSLMVKGRLLESDGIVSNIKLPDSMPGVGKRRNIYLRKLILATKRLLTFPDAYWSWFPFALFSALRELNSQSYDAIFSTSPPETNHLLGCTLARLSGLPWIADFRDPWTQNKLRETVGVLRGFEKWLEKRTLSNADAITTVSEKLVESLESLHGSKRLGTHFIPNGYDPDDYGNDIPAPSGKFIISYTGTFYGFKRDPSILIRVVDELIEEGAIDASDITIRFYGPPEPKLNDLACSIKNKEILEINGFVYRDESIRKQKESTILLIIQNEHPTYSKSLYPAKFFEYLGARRPILALASEDSILAGLIFKTNVGAATLDPENLRRILMKWIEEFKGTGTVQYRGIEEKTSEYSWESIAKIFIDLFNRV